MEGERAGHGETMPGRLNMEDQSNAAGSQGLKRDRNHASEAAGSPAVAPAGQPQTNGPAVSAPNGALPNGIAHGNTSNGISSTQSAPTLPLGPPPPLDQSWRDGPENKSLGKLMMRTAEKCWTELDEVLKKMSEQPVSDQGPGANGVMSEQDTDAVSLAKKRQLMQFASTQRERFMKALVISDWAKDADAFAGIIDVNAHLGKLNACHVGATSAVGEMKLAMNQAKMPNPNIEGALELLGTGKFQGLPDFGYIKPPKMTAKELLRTLKDMNVTLATRLSLHEELPAHFKDYTIADGRATFRVPGEFEVDLAVADEDPESPFFFIDLRFLFTPAPSEMVQHIRNVCEVEINRSMAANGLGGCYDILHNFVLTHKLNILGDQLRDLVRGKWFECIRIERVRRILILSYWTGRPGRKSWIELGIGSGRTKHTKPNQKTTPVISTRLFRRGVEVEDPELNIDWHCISLEAILLELIARHTSLLLRHVQNDLQTLAPGNSSFSTELRTSDSEPYDCKLIMNLPSLREPVSCSIEPVTGQLSISPSTPATRRIRQHLNTDPTADIPNQLASMLCATAVELVEKHAATLAWRPVRDLARQDNYRTLFGQDLRQMKLFVPSQLWGESWAIAVTVGLGGSRWWIVQLKGVEGSRHRTLTKAKRLRMPLAADAVPSRPLLLQIEQAALAEVSYTALSMQLDQLKIPHDFEKLSLIEHGNSTSQKRTPAMFLQFSKLMNPSRDRKWRPWAQELVRLTHHSDDKVVSDKEATALFTRHDLRLTVGKDSFKELKSHLGQESRDRDLAINDTGALAVRLRTPFGVPFVDQIRHKLSAIKRLNHCLTVLKRNSAKCEVASLSRLVFAYGPDHNLSAHLAFSPDSKQHFKLRLEPPETNPHILIKSLLAQSFNGTSEHSFSETVGILNLSLPVLRTVEQLQANHNSRQSLILHVRSISWYSLKYKAPFPQITFQIRTKSKTESGKRVARWHVEQERTKANAESLPEDLLKSLRELWSRSDEHCLGLNSGLAADVDGIASALEKIDEVVRKYESDAEPPPTTTTKLAAEPKSKPAAQQEVIALD